MADPPRSSRALAPLVGVFSLVWNRGVPAGITSASLFAISDSLVKASIAHVPSQEISVFRAVPSLFLGVLLARATLGDTPWLGRRETRLLLVLRGVFGAAAIELLYEAVARAPLNEATVATYTSPIVTSIVAWLALGESLRPLTCLGAAVSLLGVAIVAIPGRFGGWAEAALARGWAGDVGAGHGRRLFGLGPIPRADAGAAGGWDASSSTIAGWNDIADAIAGWNASSTAAGSAAGLARHLSADALSAAPNARVPQTYSPHTRLLGIFFAFLSAGTIAGAYLTIRAIGTRESAVTMSLWFSICSLVGGTLSLAAGWPAPPVLPTAGEWGYLVAAGLTAYGGQLCLGRSLQLLPASVGSALTFITAVELAGIGVVAYGETIVVGTVVGGAATLLGVYLVTSAKRGDKDAGPDTAVGAGEAAHRPAGAGGGEVAYQPVAATDVDGDDDDVVGEEARGVPQRQRRAEGGPSSTSGGGKVEGGAGEARAPSPEAAGRELGPDVRSASYGASEWSTGFVTTLTSPAPSPGPPRVAALDLPSAPSSAFVLDDLELGRGLEGSAGEAADAAGVATELVPLGGEGLERRHALHEPHLAPP